MDNQIVQYSVTDSRKLKWTKEMESIDYFLNNIKSAARAQIMTCTSRWAVQGRQKEICNHELEVSIVTFKIYMHVHIQQK